MSLSAAAVREIMKQNSRSKFPYLIEITDEEDNVYRYANVDETITFEDEEYSPCYFVIQPPEKINNKIGTGSIKLSGIDQTWIRKIRNASDKFKLKFVAAIIYYNEKWVTEKVEEATFVLTDASIDDTGVVSWNFKFNDKLDLNIPCDTFSTVIAPGLV